MKKKIVAAGVIVVIAGSLSIACEEWMVGAPCKPETDDGTYTKISGETYAIETRSVQCEESICVTHTYKKSEDGQGNIRLGKYSFCSCRCKDKDGHGYDRNSDKYDDLCECPPSTVCSDEVVSNNIEQVPDKLKGSYCIPECIVTPCNQDQKCTPSSDSKEPWKWKCTAE